MAMRDAQSHVVSGSQATGGYPPSYVHFGRVRRTHDVQDVCKVPYKMSRRPSLWRHPDSRQGQVTPRSRQAHVTARHVTSNQVGPGETRSSQIQVKVKSSSSRQGSSQGQVRRSQVKSRSSTQTRVKGTRRERAPSPH